MESQHAKPPPLKFQKFDCQTVQSSDVPSIYDSANASPADDRTGSEIRTDSIKPIATDSVELITNSVERIMIDSVEPIATDSVEPIAADCMLSTFFSSRDNEDSGTSPRTPYTDSEIEQVSALLKNIKIKWSLVPRTYIVLRTIGQLHFLDDFLDFGFNDDFFPVAQKSLPTLLNASAQTDFIQAQSLILTTAVYIEKGRLHQSFGPEEPLPFETKEILGSGGFRQRTTTAETDVGEVSVLKSPKQGPRRGRTAYMFFTDEQRGIVASENPHGFGQIGKILGEKWSALNSRQRAPYEAKAAADRQRYEDEKANYH